MSLKEAAQQALEALEDAQRHNYALRHKETDALITALRAALADATIKDNLTVEPVAWITPRQDLHLVNYEGFQDWAPLYTAPPKRKPLTDEEIDHLAQQDGVTAHEAPDWFVELTRAIERAHDIGSEK